jgi:hypothetical protein
MRNHSPGVLAFVLVSLSFDTNAYTEIYDFRARSFEASGGAVKQLPSVITDSTEWEILGSIIFSDDGRAFDDYEMVGGSLSVNGISLGAFESGYYEQSYFDEPPEPGDDPYSASFAINFLSEDYGPSSFSIFSEDYSDGINHPSARGYLESFPVGGYQSINVTIGPWPNSWAASIENTDIEFSVRGSEEPATPVPEPSPALLLALGMAGIFCLRRRYAI